MRTETKRAAYIFGILVITFAAAYFLLTFDRTLNTSDEGYLLYNVQKTADGQLPHRDFYDDYGPASYWLGAGLFKLFGCRILVVRVFMVILKTSMALLVFLVGVRFLPPLFAFLGSVLFTLNWGDPLIGALNVLYAGHLNHFLALLGMVLVLRYTATGNRRWLFGTSVCVGLSMLFKFPTAVIDFLGFALFLCLREQGTPRPASDSAVAEKPPSQPMLQLLRALKLLGMAGVLIFYCGYLSGPHIDLYYFFLFLLPLFLILTHMLVAELSLLRRVKAEAALQNWRGLRSVYTDIAVLLSAPIALVATILIFYALAGGLTELMYDTIELPRYLKFHYALADRKSIAALTAVIVLGAIVFIRLGAVFESRNPYLRNLFVAILVFALLLLPVFGIAAPLHYRIWHKLATHTLLSAALLTGVFLFRIRWLEHRCREADREAFLALGLTLIIASQCSLMIFLRADETHVTVNSTVIFLLAAYVLWQLHRGLQRLVPKALKPLAILAALACLAMLAIPLGWSMKILYRPFAARLGADARARPGIGPHGLLTPDAPRAAGLTLPLGETHTPPLHHLLFVDMDRTINFIRDNTRPEEKIFLLCADQTIYFLAERESVLQKRNYFVYLANVELIDRTYTGKLTDEEMRERIRSSRPRFIIQTPEYADTMRFKRVWPTTSAFIESAYEIDRVFGVFEVWKPRALMSPPP
jgi:4-amino-4-deoxy-L-arabinose transferase-like glycosyltransferase